MKSNLHTPKASGHTFTPTLDTGWPLAVTDPEIEPSNTSAGLDPTTAVTDASDKPKSHQEPNRYPTELPHFSPPILRHIQTQRSKP